MAAWVDWAVWHSCHTAQGAEERWAERRARGLTDEELTAEIGEEFGSAGGFGLGQGTPWGWHYGGLHPRVVVDNRVDRDAMVVDGRRLVNVVRRLFAIPMGVGGQGVLL
jgi:hypothetical protein